MWVLRKDTVGRQIDKLEGFEEEVVREQPMRMQR